VGTNTPKNNRADQTVADQNLIDGLTKHASTITSIMIGGASLTTKNIIAKLQTRIDDATTVVTTRATWQAAVKAEKDGRVGTRTFVSGLKQALLVAFAGQVDALADFGLTPRKPRVLTPQQKTAATAKAKATRAARHTMGKVQKSKVTGATHPVAPLPPVPGVVPTSNAGPSPAPAPVVAPATPVAPAAAAAPAAAPGQSSRA
jgi:hypothetical protein